MTEVQRRLSSLFLLNPVRLVLGAMGVAWGLTFTRFFGHWVYFPVFPNVLDSVGMVSLGVFLIYEAVKNK